MKGTDHAFSAMSALSLLLYFNSIFVIIYIESISNSKLPYWKIMLGILFLSIFIPNYFIFIHKGRYKKIAERFKEESKKQKVASSIGILALVVFTIFFGIFVLSK